MTSDLSHLVQHTVRVGWITALPDESGVVQRLQVRFTPFETSDGINSMSLYGVASSPLVGAAALSLNINGNNSNGTIIATNDGRYRPKGMTPGEIQLYDSNGQSIYLSVQGGKMAVRIVAIDEVSIAANTDVTVTAPNTTINGDLKVNGTITATGDVVGGSISLDHHDHQVGSGTSGPPIS